MSKQLSLDLDFKLDASISDFTGPGWVSIIDAVRQMHVGLVQQLYLYSGQDTGKTHLLSAICESFREIGKSAIYLSLRDLLNMDPMVLSSLESMEVIAIDDVDVIEGYLHWQEAVFHLINLSQEYGNILIFTSRLPVNQLKFDLQDLVSRLAKATTFQLPSGNDKTDRAEILYSVLQRRNWHFDSRIIEHVLNEGPHRIGAMLAVISYIQPMFSNLGRIQVPKAMIQEAIKIIDEQTLLYELKDLELPDDSESFLDD